MFEAVSLDFGGTIAYEAKEDYVVYCEVLGELGYAVDLNAVREALARARGWWRQEKARSGRIWNMDAYVDFVEYVLRVLDLPSPDELAQDVLSVLPHRVEFKAYDDAEPAIRELKRRGYRLIVISNVSSLENLSIYLARTGLRKYFDLLMASGSVGFEKPDPRIFRLASERIGVPPEEMAHVGDDYEADYLGAETAGLKGVLLDRKGAYRGKAIRRILSLTELPRLLARSEFWY